MNKKHNINYNNCMGTSVTFTLARDSYFTIKGTYYDEIGKPFEANFHKEYDEIVKELYELKLRN